MSIDSCSQPAWQPAPETADPDSYPGWLSPENIRDVIDHRQPIAAVVEVPEIAAIDVDDTIVPKHSSITRLYAAAEGSGTGVNVEQLRYLCENTSGFSPIGYLRESVGEDGLQQILSAYVSVYDPTHASPAAGRMMNRMNNDGVPHMLDTYGHPEWQVSKINGPARTAIHSVIGGLIVPERAKLPYLETFQFDEGYMVQQVDAQPPMRFVAPEVVLIDDSLDSLAGFGKGFWLNIKKPAGITELPDGIIEITSLDEVGIKDGILVKVEATGNPTSPVIDGTTATMATMPVLNPKSKLAPTVWAGYIS